jgi:hypothetical protein
MNIQKFNKIVETAKSRTDSPRWIRAIEKAAEGILAGELIVTILAHGALVTSPNGSYFVNGHCECKAAQRGHSECYHRAAARLIENYETASPAVSSVQPAATKGATRDELISSIKATWSSKFPTINLADELMARFRRNNLETLSVDFLMAIRAAIA